MNLFFNKLPIYIRTTIKQTLEIMVEVKVMEAVRVEALIEVLPVQSQLKWVRNMMWALQISAGKETTPLRILRIQKDSFVYNQTIYHSSSGNSNKSRILYM
jgi:hypothetical protein